MYDMQNWDATSYVNPTRMNHIERGIYDADLTSGGNINGNLQIDAQNGTTQAVGDTILRIGNSISQGSDKNSMGQIRIYSSGDKYARIYPQSLTANRNIQIPDKSGVLALEDEFILDEETTSNITVEGGGTDNSLIVNHGHTGYTLINVFAISSSTSLMLDGYVPASSSSIRLIVRNIAGGERTGNMVVRLLYKKS